MRDATKEEMKNVHDYIDSISQTLLSIPIPENATNGDVIMAMFPKAWKSNYIDSDNKCTLYIDDDELEVDIDWWNAPYIEADRSEEE